MTTQPKVKSYVSNFTMRLGPIATVGKMLGVRKTKDKDESGKYVYCTPDGQPVKPIYVNTNNNTETYMPSELQRAKQLSDGTLQVIPKETIAVTKQSDLPKDVVNLTVHRSADVNGSLFPSDNNAYVFEPKMDDPANVEFYLSLAEMVKDTTKAFIGMCNFKTHEGLFRLTMWRDRLVMQKMLYPDELNDHQPLSLPGLPTEAQAKLKKLAEKFVTPFDPGSYKNSVKEKLAEMEAAVLGGAIDVPVKPKSQVAQSTFDLMAALDAALDEDEKPKKKAKKSA